MKVVLDTNVWLSGIFWEGEAYHLIEKLQEKSIEIIITKKIINEIVDVLNKDAKFSRFIDKNKDTENLIRNVLYMCKIVISRSRLNIIKDHPSDNKILESAIDSKADYLISYDGHLLNLKEYKKIRMISPTDFMREITPHISSPSQGLP